MIGAFSQADLHQLRNLKNLGFNKVEIQIPDGEFTNQDLIELINYSQLTPIAFRLPKSLALGKNDFNLNNYKKIFQLCENTCKEKFLILHAATTTLGEIFEYLDAHKTEFYALKAYKNERVNRIISQIKELLPLAKKANITLLLENAPMGGREYFEPGHACFHPIFRIPENLLKVVEQTGIKLCFDTANARITSNALSYMRRSRSQFAAATEEEIINSPMNWIEFFNEIKEHVALVHLSDSISWGDTDFTTNLPFREETYPELLLFADKLPAKIPVILLNTSETMLKTLHQLKKI